MSVMSGQYNLVHADLDSPHTAAAAWLCTLACLLQISLLRHCWLGDRKGIRRVKTGCWFVGDDDLTGALHVL